MDTIPLDSDKLFPPSHEVQAIKSTEKTSAYGNQKKEPEKIVEPAPSPEEVEEEEKEKRIGKEAGKGKIIDVDA